MAERGLRRAATAPVGDRLHLTPPPEVHIPIQNRADRAFEIRSLQMDQVFSDLRKRHHSAPNLSTTDHQSSEESEVVTPTSSDDREETQAPPAEAPASGWRWLVGRTPTQPLFQATTKETPGNEDKERSRVKHKKLEDYHPGTAQFAHLLNSNDSFCIFRKFGNEAARILLRKEVELCQLATKLDELNKTDAEGDLEWRLTTFEYDDAWDPVQQKLLDEIELKLDAYYDFLLKYIDVRALPKVPPRYHKSVQNWIAGNGPLNKGEETFIENRDDFITARRTPETKNQIEDIVERFATWRAGSYLDALLGAEEEEGEKDGPTVVHLSTRRFDILSKLSAALLAVGFILAPVFILFLANLGREKMAAVVGVFVLVILFAASLVAELTAHEIFVFIVAYSAILVTLLSNFLQANASGGTPQ